ncbi:segregation/condensation protein A [Parathermosynechococcus lividus]|uniref:segregation/condensation protein A n=1 Tax=Parathermosynechococcus lividus TaxID=33070 RepID=UPI00202B6F5F|nr:segregation/condensation protein A [Thermostichus lividus]
MAHQENLTELAAEVETLLARVAPAGTWLELRDLLSLKNDPVGIFWALLFLAAQSKVDLSQDTFYQGLQVRSCCVEAVPLEA